VRRRIWTPPLATYSGLKCKTRSPSLPWRLSRLLLEAAAGEAEAAAGEAEAAAGEAEAAAGETDVKTEQSLTAAKLVGLAFHTAATAKAGGREGERGAL
jgi:hypothetical protein